MTDSMLSELNYPVINIPVLQLPLKVWFFASRVAWMLGITGTKKDEYQQLKTELYDYCQQLSDYAFKH